MPIQFRCQHCQQLLSISRRKAGSEVFCPRCDSMTLVPTAAAEAEEVKPQVVASSDEKPADDGEAPTGEFVIAAAEAPPNPWADGYEDHAEQAFSVRKGKFANDELDMTSLVDVTFLLLVFFMITASFSVQKSMQVGPPEAEEGASSGVVTLAADDIASESVMIEVDAQDRLKVDDVPVTGMAELRTLLENKRTTESKTDVIIEAAYQATHGMVVTVTDTAIAAGMQRVRRASRSRDE